MNIREGYDNAGRMSILSKQYQRIREQYNH